MRFHESFGIALIKIAFLSTDVKALRLNFFKVSLVFGLQFTVLFAIIQSTFYRLLKGQQYLKNMYEIN